MTKVRSDSTLWSSTLNALADGNGVTKATFDAWLRGTTGQMQNETLIVRVTSAFALDWLENRLRPVIERTVNHLAGERVAIRFEVGGNGVNAVQPDLFVSGVYRDTYNSIVKPEQVFVGTQYFRRAWLPLMGPVLWQLILEMRQRCYWNKDTGEKRDTFEATYHELAAVTGLSRNTVRRTLNPEDEPFQTYVNLFIPYREVTRRYSQYRGAWVNKSMLWRVRLDDPLTPEDEARLRGLTESQNGT